MDENTLNSNPINGVSSEAMNEEKEYRGRATYSPEDNKLRLYIGRVPREEYLKLKAEGWTTLHKQRDAGGGDFAAVWTPSRRDTALEYAGIIEDEDMGPDERAADRAERFGGYRDKRTNEAVGHADRYDSGPSAHGYQHAARAERAAARHDRIADRAGDAWSKAEYWQRRTAGVISHALYVSSPGVRMGRIKTIEAELRGIRASIQKRVTLWNAWQKCAAMLDPEKQQAVAYRISLSEGYLSRHEYSHPEIQADRKFSLQELLWSEPPCGIDPAIWKPITGKQACDLFFSDHREPATENDWTRHLELRLAYENQMLEAQGGRAASLDILPGGKLGRFLIVKVNKSHATGRVTSVFVKGEKINGWTYKAQDVPGADYSLHQIETERLSPNAYTPPTEESLKELEALKAERKAKAPKKEPCPLINPTDEDAEKLQAIWNDEAKADFLRRNPYGMKAEDFKPSTVCRITQATYSANSGGSYAKAETVGVCASGKEEPKEHWMSYREKRAETGPTLCKVRVTFGDGNTTNKAKRVIVLTDKPQKPLPPAVWEKFQQEDQVTCVHCKQSFPRRDWIETVWKEGVAPYRTLMDCPHSECSEEQEVHSGITEGGKPELVEV